MPKPTPETPLSIALTTARTALDERARLVGMQAKLTADLVKAERTAGDRAAAVQDAETNAMLSGDPADTEMTKKAAQARATAEAAAGQVARLRHAVAGLPERLAAADVALGAAQDVLAPLMLAGRADAWAVYAGELHRAAAVLASVLRKGHALDAAEGPGMSRHLAGMLIPNLGHGMPAILAGGTLRDDAGAVIDLVEAWRRDPAAAALHDQHAPPYAVLRELELESRRIDRARDDARHEANRLPREQPSYRTSNGGSYPPRPEYVPPKGAGPLNSHTIEQRIGPPTILSDKFLRTPAAESTHPHGDL